MLNPLVLVYTLTLIASVFADYATDVRINKTYVAFMDRFETFLTKTGDQVVLQAYQSQLNSNASHSSNNSLSLDELRQYSNSVIDPLMDQYGPIAYQIMYNAGYNTKGNYYVFDNSTKQWHLPNQTAPANPVDGASLNAKHLGQELEKAFSQLLSNDQKQSVLQKRAYFGGISRALKWGKVSPKQSELVKSIKKEDKSVQVLKIHEALKKLAKDDSAQAGIDRKYLEAQLIKARKKQLENDAYAESLREGKYKSHNWLALDWDELFKYNMAKYVGGFLLGVGVYSILESLFKKNDQPIHTTTSNNGLVSDSLNPITGIPEYVPFVTNTNSSWFDNTMNPIPISGTIPELSDSWTNTEINSQNSPVSNIPTSTQNNTLLPTSSLAKIIRNPNTGVTYYLDERNFKYYYVDHATNTSVYYKA